MLAFEIIPHSVQLIESIERNVCSLFASKAFTASEVQLYIFKCQVVPPLLHSHIALSHCASCWKSDVTTPHGTGFKAVQIHAGLLYYFSIS